MGWQTGEKGGKEGNQKEGMGRESEVLTVEIGQVFCFERVGKDDVEGEIKVAETCVYVFKTRVCV